VRYAESYKGGLLLVIIIIHHDTHSMASAPRPTVAGYVALAAS
jgi:hypothetical protein